MNILPPGLSIESSYKFSRIEEENFYKIDGVSSDALSFENGISDNKVI